ncbi:AT-rich interaction domain 6 [Menidia menidia]
MAHQDFEEERPKDPSEEMTEEQFLKNLYNFMRKRDTPIERIPNLGFKQINLFLMFKTVNDLGGYHQVTSRQLWKQVYNMLGGNPRSTSAATCTRRHYEKLLLPFECNLKGILVTAVPQQPTKHYHSDREDYGGQRPSKRRLLSLQLDQRSHNFRSDPLESLYPLPLHYPPYYHPSQPVLHPHPYIMHSAPHGFGISKPQLLFHPPHPNSTDAAKDSLAHLRNLAERYKSLTEPLNLSVKASSRETDSNPISSFSPLSNKNPKFLNKPSTLYSPHHTEVLRSEGCETEDGESSKQVTSFPFPAETREPHGIDAKAMTPSHCPVYDPVLTLGDNDSSEVTEKPSSPLSDITVRSAEDRAASPEKRGLSLSHFLETLPQPTEGKMEIEVPLSVFRKWLQLCGSPAIMHEAREPSLADHQEPIRQRTWSDLEMFSSDPRFPQHQSITEDLEPRGEPSPMPIPLTSRAQSCSSPNHFTTHKPLSLGGVLKKAASWDLWPFDHQDMDKAYNLKSTNSWDICENKSLAPSNPGNTMSLGGPQVVATKFYGEDKIQSEEENVEKEPSALRSGDSSSASVLHLTTEEVMKLKKIISSSS